jgi:predicted nucleic acid-binding protein
VVIVPLVVALPHDGMALLQPALSSEYGKLAVLLYLDLNCLNRPFDDQSQDRIARETAAIFSALQRIIDGIDQLAWSAIMGFENAQHPLVDRRTEIARWAQRAVANIAISEQVSARARALTEAGFGALDAAHVACAEAAACDCMLTCDDRLIWVARRVQLAVRVQNPVEYVEEQTHG